MLSQVKLNIEGFVKIVDLVTGEVLLNAHNAINSESMSLIVARMLQGNNSQYIYELHLGNGGVILDETGSTTVKDVSENLELGLLADLYNTVHYKVVDGFDQTNNSDETRNNVIIDHSQGLTYTDLTVTCTLEENEPVLNSGQLIFNEIGLKSKGESGVNTGFLLSHVAFSPVTKSINRVIQIIYTLRIRM
jgi:hypothetical protein